MLYNGSRFGKKTNILLRNIFNNPNEDNQLTPTPPLDHLRIIDTGERRIIDDKDYRAINTK